MPECFPTGSRVSADEERSFLRSRRGRRRIWRARDSWPPLRSRMFESIESAGSEQLCLSRGFRRSHTKYAASSDDSDGCTTQHHIRWYCNAIGPATHARRCLTENSITCDCSLSYVIHFRGHGSSHDVFSANHGGVHWALDREAQPASSYKSSAASRSRSSNTICRCVWPRKPRMPMPCSCDSARETVSSVRPR